MQIESNLTEEKIRRHTGKSSVKLIEQNSADLRSDLRSPFLRISPLRNVFPDMPALDLTNIQREIDIAGENDTHVGKRKHDLSTIAVPGGGGNRFEEKIEKIDLKKEIFGVSAVSGETGFEKIEIPIGDMSENERRIRVLDDIIMGRTSMHTMLNGRGPINAQLMNFEENSIKSRENSLNKSRENSPDLANPGKFAIKKKEDREESRGKGNQVFLEPLSNHTTQSKSNGANDNGVNHSSANGGSNISKGGANIAISNSASANIPAEQIGNEQIVFDVVGNGNDIPPVFQEGRHQQGNSSRSTSTRPLVTYRESTQECPPNGSFNRNEPIEIDLGYFSSQFSSAKFSSSSASVASQQGKVGNFGTFGKFGNSVPFCEVLSDR